MAPSRLLGSLVLAFAMLAGACAAPTDADPAEDGELAGGDDDPESSAEDALTTRTIGSYVPVAPPEHLVVTGAESALVGTTLVVGHRLAVIRTAVFEGKAAKLVVDEESFATSLVTQVALGRGARAATTGDAVDTSPWSRSLADVARRGQALEHLAVTPASLGAAEPFALTIDMCQSRKAWEKRLFDWAVRLADQRGEPTKIGVAMTGVWAKAHPDELDQILAWQRSGKLDITWVNHSSTHPLHCLDASCRRAEFLTHRSVDMDEEVLGEERVALARGMAPSALFRFPGLTHDARRLAQLSRLSMMALDADGWIAKGQPIAPGRVVLVHGNGNEPEGITGFLQQVQTPARKASLASGQTLLVSPLLAAPVPPR